MSKTRRRGPAQLIGLHRTQASTKIDTSSVMIMRASLWFFHVILSMKRFVRSSIGYCRTVVKQ